MDRVRELAEELKMVFSGRGARLLDSLLPLLIYLIVNPILGTITALWGAVGIAGIVAIFRILRHESLLYTLAGLGGVFVAALFVKISGSEVGFFFPGLISSAVTIIVFVLSAAINRPLVAWTSFVVRRWPLDWYWHPQILPAYTEGTIIWGVVFAARLGFEYWLYQRDALDVLGVTRIALGWPLIVVLLIGTYLYGLMRLNQLQGPSVEEFKSDALPPWQGQKRGF